MTDPGRFRARSETVEIRLAGLRVQSQGWWPMSEALAALAKPGPRRVILVWAAAVVLSALCGIGVVYFNLSAIPLPLGLTTVSVTIYPPILLGMLLLLWLGPAWAISATYLATFALGTYAGLSPGAALFFSLADPAQLLVVWGGLMVLDVPFEIRTWGNRAFFLALVLTGSVASSLGALVWNYAHHLDFDQGFDIWQGWVVGAFIQGGLLVLPIHRFAGARARSWLEDNLQLPRRQNLGPQGGAVLLLSALLLVAAITVQVALQFASSVARAEQPEIALASRLPELGLFVLLILASFIGSAILFTVALTRRTERERTLARVDALMGCLNRLAFGEIYARESDRSSRLGLPLSAIFVDLDRFKAINDEHGYAAGDQALRQTAERMHATTRDTDYLFRWGGEEFIVLLPHTDPEKARSMAERLRMSIRSHPLLLGGLEVSVTASFGVAGSQHPPGSPRELVDPASHACREAKQKGRDRVEPA